MTSVDFGEGIAKTDADRVDYICVRGSSPLGPGPMPHVLQTHPPPLPPTASLPVQWLHVSSDRVRKRHFPSPGSVSFVIKLHISLTR